MQKTQSFRVRWDVWVVDSVKHQNAKKKDNYPDHLPANNQDDGSMLQLQQNSRDLVWHRDVVWVAERGKPTVYILDISWL